MDQSLRLLIFTDPHRSNNEKTSVVHDRVFSSLNPQDFDVVVVSGDWGSSSLLHVKKAFKAFRIAFPDKPIVGVLGNHDYWDTDKSLKISNKMNKINEFAKRFDIHLLENNPFETNDVLIMGFNGWYKYPHFQTKDSEFMRSYEEGKSVDNYLNDLADKAVNYMIDYPKKQKKVISVTHFPCVEESDDKPEWNGNPVHGEILLEFSDVIIFGHTHKEYDEVVRGCRVLNVGNDYNKLVYKIIEV